MRKFLLMIGLLALLKTSSAQDPNFSQFFVSPLTLNPAMTGKFNGDGIFIFEKILAPPAFDVLIKLLRWLYHVFTFLNCPESLLLLFQLSVFKVLQFPLQQTYFRQLESCLPVRLWTMPSCRHHSHPELSLLSD